MSRYQPSLREAVESVATIERMVAAAKESRPAEWFVERPAYGPERIHADGFYIRWPRHRGWMTLRWPMSAITHRCDTCRCVLRATRDAGGQGFYYDGRWLEGNPAERDPRSNNYRPLHACLPCFNRVRAKIRVAEQINENRLLINRIKKESRNAN